MPEAKESVLHQQALVVMGLLTGFALTSLVVILGSPTAYRVAVGPLPADAYFEALVTAVALLGSVSLFGVLATMEVAGGLAVAGGRLDRLGYACFLVGLLSLMVVLPLLLVPASAAGAAVVVAVEAILLVAYFAA